MSRRGGIARRRSPATAAAPRDAMANIETGILCNGEDEDDVDLDSARLLDDEALRGVRTSGGWLGLGQA
jgi:hypothetical protein